MKFVSSLDFPLEAYRENTKKYEAVHSFLDIVLLSYPTFSQKEFLIKDDNASYGSNHCTSFGFVYDYSRTTFGNLEKIENLNERFNLEFPIDSIKYYMYINFIS